MSTTAAPAKLEVKDSKATETQLREFFKGCATSLNSMMSMEGFPAAVKAELKSMYDAANAQLAKMTPLEMVPAALDAGYTLNSLACAYDRMAGMVQEMMAVTANFQTQFAAQGLKLAALESKVAAGELLDLDTVKKNEATAITAALGERTVLLASRREALVKAGLPLLEESQLLGEEKEFQNKLTRATTRATTLKSKGLTTLLAGAEGAEMLFLGESEYARTLRLAQAAVSASGSSVFHGDPLLGGAAGEPGQKKVVGF